MTLFIAIAALITVLAVLLLVSPLLARSAPSSGAIGSELNLAILRDQLRELDADREAGTIDAAAYASARAELELRVARDVLPVAAAPAVGESMPWQAAVLALLVVGSAAALYAGLGNPAGLAAQPAAAPPQAAAHKADAAEAMVERLAARLSSEPQDAQGWLLLARSYSAMNRFKAASEAYARLLALVPEDAQLLADYADVLAMTQQQSLRGMPEQILVRALAADPNNIKALVLMGDAQYERGDAAAAIAHWKAVLPLAPPGSEMAQMAQANIEHAQKQGAPAPAVAAVAAAAPGKVSGTVDLAPALRAKASPDDIVFIFARAVDGPRFPLAILRKQVRELPLKFELDDSMGMVPTAKLSDFQKLVLGARIAKSGSATPSPGDLEGLTEGVINGSAGIRITIDTQRP